MKFSHLLSTTLVLFIFAGMLQAQDTTFTVTADGRLGIGTTSPEATVDLRGGLQIRAKGFTGNAGGVPGGLTIIGKAGTFDPSLSLDNGSQQWNIVSWNDDALKFVKSTGSTFTPFSISNKSFQDALVIGENGVGIGTDAPQATFDLRGNQQIRAIGFTGNASGSSGGLQILGEPGTFDPSIALDNGSQQWNIVSWRDNDLKFVKSTGSTFTPLTIKNESFQDAVVIGEKGVGIGKNNPSERLDVVGNIAVSGTVDGVDISALANRTCNYTTFKNLNRGAVNVTSNWTELNLSNNPLAFRKQYDDSKIEVIVNSRFYSGIFSGAFGMWFQVRVNGAASPNSNDGSIRQSDTEEFLSIFAAFEGLPAGNYTVSIYSRTNPGGSSSSNVFADPGGWGGAIIVKETW